MSSPLSTPQTDTELIRQLIQRVRALERKQTFRAGKWVVGADDDGNLVATAPGEVTQDVGNPESQVVDLTSTRGYQELKKTVALAVSAGASHNLGRARQSQVDKDTATASAQTSADNANAAAAAIEAQLAAGSNTFYNDTFDRPANNNLGGDYARITSGLGPNNYGTDGSGHAANVGKISGTGYYSWIDIQTAAPFVTNKQLISAVLDSPPPVGRFGDGSNSRLELAGRCSVDGTSRVSAIIEWDRACIGYYAGGGFVQLTNGSKGGWQIIGESDGDRWDLWVGTDLTGDDQYHFILLRNSQVVVDVIDITRNSHIGPGYMNGGLGGSMGQKTAFYVTYTIAGPTLQAVNFADRT